MSETLPSTVLKLLAAGRIDRQTAKSLLAAAVEQRPAEDSPKIAIVGMAAQLPGADTVDDFWDVLIRGADRVSALPAHRRSLGAVRPLAGDRPRGAWLRDIDRFDAGFFGVTAAEARAMDPQQRRFLQTAYHCLEDAGYAGDLRGSRTGVYVSAAMVDYIDALPELTPVSVPANVASFVASRLSHFLDLRGPALVTSATCASSLLALHTACAGLATGDCDTAIVGGVNIVPFPGAAGRHMMSVSGISSPDQRCRPFDDGGDGIGYGEGVAALLLKPLDAARRDGDRIHAVLLGSSVNNDGAGAALTAPNPAAHTELLLAAWRRANTSPESLAYLEAHGTGTKLGDPIEVKGITDAIRRHTDRRQFLPIGSVKGNIGHLVDGMAGLSGLIKAILVLKHRTVPPTPGFRDPNRHIDFLDSPVYVPSRPWPIEAAGAPLRAGVSCFGFNGTNVHVVVEEPPALDSTAEEPPDGPFVFPLSARTPEALRALLNHHAARAETVAAHRLAHALWARREHFATRVAIVAADTREFRARCRELAGAAQSRWGEAAAADAMTRTYLDGAMPPWQEVFGTGPAPAVPLPLYPFEEKPYWIEPPAETAPTGETTLDRLLGILRHVLGADGIRAEDSFVQVGGSSLSGLQVAAELRRAGFGAVSPTSILTAPSIAELAVSLEPHGPEPHGPEARGLEARGLEARGAERETSGGELARTTFPLSQAQRSFWFLSQTENVEGFYHVPMLLRLRGRLAVDALRAALTRVQARQDVLRSRYPLSDTGLPVMEILPRSEVTLAVEDLRERPPEDREQAARTAAREFLRQEFDLAAGPVWRARLWRIDDDDHLLVLSLHHLICDIWSLTLLEDELRAAYRGRLAGTEPPHAELDVHYGELSELEKSELDGAEGRRLDAFWRQAVASYGAPLEIPGVRVRPAERSLDGATLTFEVPEATARRVREVGARHGCTPFMTMFAAFAVQLRAGSGRDDVLVGTETAGRARPGAADVIGAFVNQLALRVDLGGDPDVGQTLRRVKDTVLSAREHEAMPFARLINVVRPERGPDAPPLFRIKFLFSSLSWGGSPLADGLDTELDDLGTDVSPFDLTLRVFEQRRPDGRQCFTGSLTYSSALYDAAWAHRFSAEYVALLDRLLSDTTARLSDLDRSPPDQKGRRVISQQPRSDPKSASVRGFRHRVPSPSGPIVRTRYPADSDTWPLIVEPAIGGVDLAEWITAHRDTVEEMVLGHGGVLFHGFNISSVDEFHAVSTAVHPELVEYTEPSTPRTEYREKVYVSSEYPHWYTIPQHGELSYTYKWPMKALFTCRQEAETGGATPLSDARKVLRELDPRVRDTFLEKRILYQRNYGDGLLVPWQKVFDTTDPAEVERYCRDNPPMTAEWLDDTRLRTRQIRSAVATHPITGDEVWFNQAHIFHVYSLGPKMRDQLMDQFGEANLPVHAFYGDGTPITDGDLDAIYQAYEKATWSAPWHKGDVLLADNMLTSHGRQAFTGAREVMVCFVEPCPPPPFAYEAHSRRGRA